MNQVTEVDEKKLKALIDKSNKAFKALSVEEQRVEIIKDAIKQIKAGKFVAEEGTYLSDVDGDSTDLQTNLWQASECNCCAKGAIFASCVLKTDKVSEDDDYNDNDFIIKKLKKWFGKEELDMIEVAFEIDASISGGGLYSRKPDLADACEDYGRRYDGPESRLLGILKNTLKYGKFDPYCGKKNKK